MATKAINGIDIRYEDSGGSGAPLLFSHGFMMDHTMFDPQVAHFSAANRCIRWDERGFGDTRAASDRLGEITCPVLVIHGTEDHAIPMERAKAVADGVSDCRGFVEVPGAAHAPNLSHPDIVNEAIAGFLAGL